MPATSSVGDGVLGKHKQVTIHSHVSPLGGPFNPTRLHFADISRTSSDPVGEWSSRRARKGRYLPKEAGVHWVPAPATARGTEEGRGKEEGRGLESRVVQARVKEAESHLKPGWRGDISFWVAFTFTLGSMVWVVNGFLVWFPILRPDLAGATYSSTAAALAFLGGTIFEVGSYLMVVEALDRGRETSFGTAIEEVLQHRRATPAAHDHERHREVVDKVAQMGHAIPHDEGSSESRRMKRAAQGGARGWVWWGKPMWRDMGYDAAVVQLFAASVFWIATLTGLPGVIPGLYTETASVPIEDVFYWTPQVVGGSGFTLSALILMIEVQTKWYIPKLDDIGWHIGFWNLIGALGFTLCGALGYSSSSGAVYQSALSTFWGSWAFLIGSGIQICESVWREAPETDESSPSTPSGATEKKRM